MVISDIGVYGSFFYEQTLIKLLAGLTTVKFVQSLLMLNLTNLQVLFFLIIIIKSINEKLVKLFAKQIMGPSLIKLF